MNGAGFGRFGGRTIFMGEHEKLNYKDKTKKLYNHYYRLPD